MDVHVGRPITTTSLVLTKCGLLPMHVAMCEGEEVDYDALFVLTQEDLDGLGSPRHDQGRLARGLATLKCYGDHFAVYRGRPATEKDYVLWMLYQNDIGGTYALQP